MNPNVVSSSDIALVSRIVSQKLRNSMLWMLWGLATTFIVMYSTLHRVDWLRFIYQYYEFIIFAELGVVILFSARVMRASITALKAMFFSYAILNGFTLTAVALAYRPDVVIPAFIGTVALFAAFAIVGAVTKKDLSSLSTYLLVALIGMIITSIVMFFTGFNDTVSLVLGYVGVVVFSIFTAVDVNRIKQNVTQAVLADDESLLDRVELVGALSLYLDFINLFLSLLRIFNRR